MSIQITSQFTIKKYYLHKLPEKWNLPSDWVEPILSWNTECIPLWSQWISPSTYSAVFPSEPTSSCCATESLRLLAVWEVSFLIETCSSLSRGKEIINKKIVMAKDSLVSSCISFLKTKLDDNVVIMMPSYRHSLLTSRVFIFPPKQFRLCRLFSSSSSSSWKLSLFFLLPVPLEWN